MTDNEETSALPALKSWKTKIVPVLVNLVSTKNLGLDWCEMYRQFCPRSTKQECQILEIIKAVRKYWREEAVTKNQICSEDSMTYFVDNYLQDMLDDDSYMMLQNVEQFSKEMKYFLEFMKECDSQTSSSLPTTAKKMKMNGDTSTLSTTARGVTAPADASSLRELLSKSGCQNLENGQAPSTASIFAHPPATTFYI